MLQRLLCLQDVVDGIEELQCHQTAMNKIPLMVSMEKIPPQMTQTLMQVLTARQAFRSPLCTLLMYPTSQMLLGHCRASRCSISTAQILDRLSVCDVQKTRSCIPDDKLKQMQSIVASRRRQFARQQAGQSQVRIMCAVL